MKGSATLGAVFRYGQLWAFLNLLFFGSVIVSALAMQFFLIPPLASGSSQSISTVWFGDNVLLMFLGIFVFNLCLSAFVFVTLPGMAFFPLSAAALVYRGVLWGWLVYNFTAWRFLAFLPTIFLEGEAYVVAAVAGTVVGASWAVPKRLFPDAVGRREAFWKAVREGWRIYVFVALLLVVAAAVETAALMLFR